jgi:hypothetical protein
VSFLTFERGLFGQPARQYKLAVAGLAVPGLWGRLFFEFRDQSAQLRGTGVKSKQLARVPQGCAKIAGVASDRDQRHQHVPVGRMLPMRFVQDGHCLSGFAGRVQGDGVDIGVARIVRRELTGSAQQADRFNQIGQLQNTRIIPEQTKARLIFIMIL